MKPSIFIGVLMPLLLSGCQQAPSPQSTVSKSLPPLTGQSVQQTQQQLWLDGALNQRHNRLPPTFSANSDRLSVDWEGDAIELLAQLARQRGLNFGYTGVRLPLPVSVHVSNITFENLLRQLETQIGWRATLKQQAPELHLYFTLPDKGVRIA